MNVNKKQLAAAFLSGTDTGSAVDAVSSFERREMIRLINSHTANRERFMQKLRSPAYQGSAWKTENILR